MLATPEPGEDHRSHGGRFALEPAPGDADDAVPGQLELGVAHAVALERAARASEEVVAVKLDDQALARPQGVHRVAAGEHVDRGQRYVVRAAERQEPALERGARVLQ